jgi:hypothetical protein
MNSASAFVKLLKSVQMGTFVLSKSSKNELENQLMCTGSCFMRGLFKTFESRGFLQPISLCFCSCCSRKVSTKENSGCGFVSVLYSFKKRILFKTTTIEIGVFTDTIL